MVPLCKSTADVVPCLLYIQILSLYSGMCAVVSFVCLFQSKARVWPAIRTVFQTSSRPNRGEWRSWTQGKDIVTHWNYQIITVCQEFVGRKKEGISVTAYHPWLVGRKFDGFVLVSRETRLESHHGCLKLSWGGATPSSRLIVSRMRRSSYCTSLTWWR